MRECVYAATYNAVGLADEGDDGGGVVAAVVGPFRRRSAARNAASAGPLTVRETCSFPFRLSLDDP